MKKSVIEDRPYIETLATCDDPRLDGVVIGCLIALDEKGAPLVDFPGNDAGRPLLAAATRSYQGSDIGCEVALLFIGGDPARPLLVGPLVRPPAATANPGSPAANVTVDGGVTTITGEQEIVLRCGKGSITLRRDGKIVIKGTHLLSSAAGVNRIKGGQVNIN
jgi:hypothetical protein